MIDNAAFGVTLTSSAPTSMAGQAITKVAGDVIISGIVSSNPAFTVTGGTGMIAAGASMAFTVTFNPAAPGAQMTTITNDAINASIFTFVVGAAATAVSASISTFAASTWIL